MSQQSVISTGVIMNGSGVSMASMNTLFTNAQSNFTELYTYLGSPGGSGTLGSSSIAFSPTGGNVTISPVSGQVIIGPSVTGSINNMSIGATTPKAGTFTAVTAGINGTVGGTYVIAGATSGSLTLATAAVAGANTLKFPAGSTDFTATGGTSQVVKQTSNGGAFSVAQLAASDLSNGTTGSGFVVLATSPTLTTPTLSGATVATSSVTIQGSNALILGNAGSNNDFSIYKNGTRQITFDSGPTTGVGVRVNVGAGGSSGTQLVINTGADNLFLAGIQNSDNGHYNLISFSGQASGISSVGLDGGGSSDGVLYLTVPATWNFQFLVGGVSKANIDSGGTFHTTSDPSLKTDVEVVANGLALVRQLLPVHYIRPGDGDDNLRQLGLMGPHVMDVFGEQFSVAKKAPPNHGTDIGLTTVAYPQLVVPAIDAVKTLDREVGDLKAIHIYEQRNELPGVCAVGVDADGLLVAAWSEARRIVAKTNDIDVQSVWPILERELGCRPGMSDPGRLPVLGSVRQIDIEHPGDVPTVADFQPPERAMLSAHKTMCETATAAHAANVKECADALAEAQRKHAARLASHEQRKAETEAHEAAVAEWQPRYDAALATLRQDQATWDGKAAEWCQTHGRIAAPGERVPLSVDQFIAAPTRAQTGWWVVGVEGQGDSIQLALVDPEARDLTGRERRCYLGRLNHVLVEDKTLSNGITVPAGTPMIEVGVG